MNALPESYLDAAWRWLIRPRTQAGLALVAVALLIAEAADPAAPLSAAQRFIAVIAVGAALALGHTVAYASRSLRGPLLHLLAYLKLIERHPLPFFDEELRDEASGFLRRHARRARVMFFGLGALIALAVGGAAALMLAHAMTLDEGGYLTLTPGNLETAYSTDGADGMQRVHLGYEARLDGLGVTEDGRTWEAVVNAEVVRDGTSAVLRMRQGERTLVGGRWISLFEVRPTSAISSATLLFTRRADGEQVQHTLRPGQRVTLADGDEVRLVDTSGGDPRMGTSVQLEEYRGDTLVRREWVFASEPGFDGRHGSGNWGAQIGATQPELTAVFAVRPAGAVYWMYVGWGLLGLALLLPLVLIRPAYLRFGVSGDYELIVVRGLGPVADPSEGYAALVPAELLAAWRQGGQV